MPPEPDPRTDIDLLAAARRGDHRAFESLYHRHKGFVHRLAFRFTRSEDDALDAVQETFAHLARKLPTLALTARLTTYLYPVVRSVSIDIVRRRRPLKPDAALADVPAPPAPEPTEHVELLAALESLSEPHREAILMRFVDGFSLDEISQLTGAPLGTVKSRLHNALAALREDPRCRAFFGVDEKNPLSP